MSAPNKTTKPPSPPIPPEAGAVTQTIKVTPAAPVLDSQTSSLGQVIENKRIVDLPLNGRNPFQLGVLSGGAVAFQGLTTNLPILAGGGRHNANDIRHGVTTIFAISTANGKPPHHIPPERREEFSQTKAAAETHQRG